jgi:hypothetical protein
MPLAVHRPRKPCSATLAAWSRGALDRPLSGDAELTIASPDDACAVHGAFDRGGPRRGSGGPPVLVGPGTIWLTLALARPNALVSCTPDKLVNRHVRPILRALTKTAGLAHYFGRDWISVGKRPAGWIGFAHDARTQRAVVEAFVAVTTPFSAPRESFLGKPPGTLEEIAGKPLDLDRIADAIAGAFGEGAEVDLPAPEVEPPSPADPPWTARIREAIGDVCAGRDAHGRMRLGGELLASRDAIAEIEEAIARLPPDAVDERTLGRIVDDAFHRPNVVLDGVRSLTSLRDVLLNALAG